MNIWAKRALAVTVGVFSIILVGAAWIYGVLWSRYDDAQQQLESRTQRLDGLISVGSQIEALLEVVRKNLAPWVRPDSDNAQNEIQQRLREMIAASGSTLISSQVALEPAAEGKLATVRLTATIGGEWAGLVQFMNSLHTQMPPLWVRSANLQRDGISSGTQNQKARITLQLEAPLVSEQAQP